jgi:hypothetical protein
VLKQGYLPAFDNQLTVEPSAFMEKIAKENLTNAMLTGAAPIGINGGFGYGAEGSATPSAGALSYDAYKLAAKDMYVDIQLSHKTVLLGQNNVSSIVDVVANEVESSYQSAKWNVSRSLFGDGTGKLATLGAAVETTSTTIKVNDVSKLIEGLMIDIYGAGAATPGVTCARIKSINRVKGGDGFYTVTLTAQAGGTATNGGFVTVQGSYNREITGLGAIFDHTACPTLYGLSKADHEYLKPYTQDAGNDINDMVLYDGVKYARDYKNAKIDLIMMGDGAFRAYRQYLIEAQVTVVNANRKFTGGAAGITVLVGDQQVDIVNERFVPENTAWGVDTTAFKFHRTPFDFATYNGSSAFELINGSSIYRALLASYGELVCKNPGGCIEFTNCGIA